MRTRGLMVFVFALIMVVLAGTSFAQRPVTLVLEVGGNNEEIETRRIAIDAFMAANPDIEVELRVLQGWTDERVTRYVGGAAPDVTMEWELEFANFADNGMYLDLAPFIARDPEFQEVMERDLFRPLLQAFQWDGKQLGLPEQNAAVVLFYNVDHFAEAGLADPPMEWDDPTWDWAAFLDAAQKLTRRNADEVLRYGYGDMWWTQLTMMLWGWSNGGEWFDQMNNPTRSTLSDERMVEAIQFYADLWNLWNVAPTWPERVQKDTVMRFADGSMSMGVTGHWFVPMFSQAGIRYDVAPLPRGPQGASGMSDLGTTGLAIYNTTEHPEEAWRLVRFLAGVEGQKVYARSGLFVPVVRSAVPDFMAAAHRTPRSEVFLTAVNHAKPLPATVHWGEYVAQGFNPMLHDVMENIRPARVVAEEIDRMANTSIFGQ